MDEVKNIVPIVGVSSNRVVASSRDVAAFFGKRHDNVIRDIRKLLPELPEKWGVLNFEDTSYVDSQNGQTYEMFQMTRDGFILLVMGFTGKQALKFKLEYIEEYDRMEAALSYRGECLWEQMKALIAEETKSEIKASFGSRLMNNRKKEIPALRSRRTELEDEIQPELTFTH